MARWEPEFGHFTDSLGYGVERNYRLNRRLTPSPLSRLARKKQSDPRTMAKQIKHVSWMSFSQASGATYPFSAPSFSSVWQRLTKVSPYSPTQAPCWNSSNARVGYKGLGLHRAGLYTHTTFPINQVRVEKQFQLQ